MIPAAILYSSVIIQVFDKYPEITWFADQGVVITQEASADSKLSGWTEFLVKDGRLASTNKSYPELERMLQSVVCFHVLLQGVDQNGEINLPAYNYWVQGQGNTVRLSQQDFMDLAKLAQKHGKNHIVKESIEACLVYSDLGKTPQARINAKHYGLQLEDHDDLIKQVFTLENADIAKIIPSFATLDPNVQATVKILYSAVPLHWGHLCHLEGGINMFTALLASKSFTRDALEQCYLINMCDVAGAAAHVNFNGALAFNKITNIRYRLVLNAIETLLAKRDPRFTLNFMRESVAQLLGFPMPLTANDAVLARMGAFLRFTSKEEGALLKHASAIYSAADWELMDHVFADFTGINTWTRNPTYMPALLLNVFNYNYPQGTEQIERYKNALATGLWLAKYCQAREHSASSNNEPINFNDLAGRAKADPVRFLQTDPVATAIADENKARTARIVGEIIDGLLLSVFSKIEGPLPRTTGVVAKADFAKNPGLGAKPTR